MSEPVADPAAIDAARGAVACEPLADVLRAISEPLSLGRAGRNLLLAVETYGLRIDADPSVAARELCGR